MDVAPDDRRPAGYHRPATAFALAEAHGKKTDVERAEFFVQRCQQLLARHALIVWRRWPPFGRHLV